MIHEEICTYEVCKLAKEKGFNEYETCSHIYEDNEQWHTLTTYTNVKGIDWSKDKFTVAPTQSLLSRWLREEKKLEITAFWDTADRVWLVYVQRMYMLEVTGTFPLDGEFPTYERALENGLKYALENLV